MSLRLDLGPPAVAALCRRAAHVTGPYGAWPGLQSAVAAASCRRWRALAVADGRPARARPVKLVAFGDSLTAGYKLPADAAFPAVLETALRAKGYDVDGRQCRRVGRHRRGRARAARLVGAGGTDAVIVELGANDMLRGLDPATTEKTLDTIADAPAGARHQGAAGRHAGAAEPRGGLRARASTRSIRRSPSSTACRSTRSSSTGVAQDPKLNLPDGMHPNAAGVEVIVDGILPASKRWCGRSRRKAERSQLAGLGGLSGGFESRSRGCPLMTIRPCADCSLPARLLLSLLPGCCAGVARAGPAGRRASPPTAPPRGSTAPRRRSTSRGRADAGPTCRTPRCSGCAAQIDPVGLDHPGRRRPTSRRARTPPRPGSPSSAPSPTPKAPPRIGRHHGRARRAGKAVQRSRRDASSAPRCCWCRTTSSTPRSAACAAACSPARCWPSPTACSIRACGSRSCRELPSDLRALSFLASDWYDGVASKIKRWELPLVLVGAAADRGRALRAGAARWRGGSRAAAPRHGRADAAAQGRRRRSGSRWSPRWCRSPPCCWPARPQRVRPARTPGSMPIVSAFVRGVLIVSVTVGLARGFLAPRRPNWRLPADLGRRRPSSSTALTIAVSCSSPSPARRGAQRHDLGRPADRGRLARPARPPPRPCRWP